MKITSVVSEGRRIYIVYKRVFFALAWFATFLIACLQPAVSHAATMTQVFVQFDRMQTSTASTGTVCAKPATSSTNVKTWTVTFPTGYTVSTTVANWQSSNISTTNVAWPSGAVAWPNASSATASVSGQTVTWTNGTVQTMNNTSLYCYNWDSSSALTITASANPSNLGTVATQDNTATQIDSGQYATASITNDQIVVTATVPTAFSFALSGNTDALGNLSSSGINASPTPRTATVNTNARNGWSVWAKDASSGLSSTIASKTIASNCSGGVGSNSTLTGGTEGYNTGLTSTQSGGTGSITVATPFVGGISGKGGGLCSSNLQLLASSSGTANNAVLTMTNNVTIAASTPAATDYTDTITVVGAGLF